MKKFAFLMCLSLVFFVLTSCGGGGVKYKGVAFEFKDVNAETVFLAGEFQGWNPKDSSWEMTKKGNVFFIEDIDLDDGTYAFKFCPNGDWIKSMEDYKDKIAVYKNGKKMEISFVDDGFGGKNAKVVIK